MSISKTMLAAGGIVAVAGTLLLSNSDKPTETALSVSQEMSIRLPGQEIQALRSENSEAIKVDNNTVATRVYAKKKYYKDEDGKYKTPDLSVKEISALAKLNPFRSHDKYVDAGRFQATWLNNSEDDYTILSNDKSVKFRTLHDKKGIAVFKEIQKSGIKETYVILNDSTDKALIWRVESEKMKLNSDGSVNIDGFQITAPIAWDNKNNPVKITVQVSGDTLKYIPNLKNAVYPVKIDPSVIVNDSDATSGAIITDVLASYASAHDTTSATAVSAAYILVGQVKVSTTYGVLRSLLRFDTSAIPDDAIIDSVKFKIAVQNKDYLAAGQSFYMHIIEAQDTVSTAHLTAGMFSRFKTWAAGTAAYNATNLADSVSITTSLSAGDTLTHNFNALGKTKINKTGTIQFYLMSGKDIGRVAPTDVQRIDLADDSPYLLIYYSFPGGLVVNTTASLTASGTLSHEHPSTYTGARDTTTAVGAFPNFSTDGINSVGQYKTGTAYIVKRSQLGFDLSAISASDTIATAELWFYGKADSSTTDFNIYGINSTKTGSLSREWFNDFNGWGASGAYSPVYLTSAWSTSIYNSGWNYVSFTTAGKDSLNAHKGGSIAMALLSGNDISNTAPANVEYITIGGAANAPYLKIYYTPRVPQCVTVTAISPDSLLIEWQDKTGDETGFRIISGASTAIDSTSEDATSKRVGGLTANTLYTLKVQVKGGTIDGQYSAADQCYTKANTPGQPVVEYRRKMGLAFNGVNQYAVIPHYAAISFNASQSFTIAGWFYLTWDNSSSGRLYTKYRNYYAFLNSGTINQYVFTMYDGTHGANIAVTITNGWHHIAQVIDRSQQKGFVYLDGTLAGTDADISDVGDCSNTNNLYLATNDLAASVFGNNKQDDFRIYNVAKSQAEIQALRYNEAIGTETGFAGYWKMNEGTGTTAYNSVTGGQDGTLYNSPTWTLGNIYPSFPDTLAVVRIKENSNPAITRYALQDSLTDLFVQRIAGIDTFGVTASWGTYTEWSGVSGDTVKVKPGKNYVIRVKAKSGSD